MKKGLIGVILMMLKNQIAHDGAYAVLKKLSELGIHCIEISQVPMTAENVTAIRQASKDFSIEVAACSAAIAPMFPGMPGETLQKDFNKIVSDCLSLDCKLLRIGMLPISLMNNYDMILEFIHEMDETAYRLAKHGIELYYHNHHIEFKKYNGTYLLDLIKQHTQHIGFELDVHWIQRGGENPVCYIQNYAGRIKLIHLKDYRIGEIDLSFMKNGMNHNAFSQAFSGVVQFAEVGEGNLPMNEIIDTGLACGSQFFIIEQDDTYGRDPFDCIKTSHDNLIAMGYSDWFTR